MIFSVMDWHVLDVFWKSAFSRFDRIEQFLSNIMQTYWKNAMW